MYIYPLLVAQLIITPLLTAAVPTAVLALHSLLNVRLCREGAMGDKRLLQLFIASS